VDISKTPPDSGVCYTSVVQYINGLNERQKEAVLNTEGPLLIIAGAGAGKTKTITHRIAHLMARGTPSHRILAVTFTNKAAGEMRDRVRTLLQGQSGMPLITTFHSLGVRILREFHQDADLPRNFSIWDRDDSTKAIKRIQGDSDEGTKARAIISAISREKGNGISAPTYEERARTFREKELARLWRAYEVSLREEGALDFDDLLLRTVNLLNTSQKTLEMLRDRYAYITIDEYQDTNKTQYEIARLLAGERKNICVVGDIDQNIYSWRGADIEHLLSFEKSFPGAATVLLEQNYRSTRTILAAANGVISKNLRRREKNLFTENETGEPLALYGARNEVDEAWFIAATAQKLIDGGTPPSEIAVLYRENFQSRAIEEALLHLSVPYRVLGTRFFERKEVKDLLSYVRAALNPLSKVDFARAVATPSRGIGKTTLEKIFAGEEATLNASARAKIAQFREKLVKIAHAARTLPPSEALRFSLEESGIETALRKDLEEGSERMENLNELLNLAVRYDDMKAPEGIEKMLEEAALQSDQDELSEAQDAVSLMTVHASKGLEFDVVFVTGLEQGLFPSLREDTRDPEEERRLFYVAITRARKQVYLSYAADRMRWGSREYTSPSEFFDDIDPRLVVSVNPGDSTGEKTIEFL
jgi:DNA helicase II / ATP-dependent DNA helicase PcrA